MSIRPVVAAPVLGYWPAGLALLVGIGILIVWRMRARRRTAAAASPSSPRSETQSDGP